MPFLLIRVEFLIYLRVFFLFLRLLSHLGIQNLVLNFHGVSVKRVSKFGLNRNFSRRSLQQSSKTQPNSLYFSELHIYYKIMY